MAESLCQATRTLGPRRPSLYGVAAGVMPLRPSGTYVLVSAVRRGRSGEMACDGLTAEVRQVAAQVGVPVLAMAHRSAATVEYRGRLQWASGDLVYEDGPGPDSQGGPAGDREPRVPQVPPGTLSARAEPPHDAP
jgi:hypothetical protein